MVHAGMDQDGLLIRTIAKEHFDGAALGALLSDAVESGASLGFLPPLRPEAAKAYWVEVKAGLGRQRLLLGAYRRGVLVGTVQLALEARANGAHRAEVQKLMVARAFRRLGIGRALMAAVEALALASGRSLLVLDARVGDAAERLYAGLGWSRAGEIPGYAAGADGGRQATAIYYKQL